jgi:hypothetical protein
MISKSNLVILIIVFFAGIFVTNCSDDEKEDTLVGTWVLTSMRVSTMGITFTVDPAELGLSMRLTVREDNSYTMVITENGETSTSNGEWATSGNKLFITEEGETEEFVYSLKGDKLEITYEEMEQGQTVTTTQIFTRQ